LDFADAAKVFARVTLTLVDDRQDYGERRFQTCAEIAIGGKAVSPAQGTLTHPRGRPKKADAKVHTHIRLSPQVLGHFRATGPGWQTRIDEVLRKWVERHRKEARPRTKHIRVA
jgi:uncharacterized protein (DUF4415 family)